VAYLDADDPIGDVRGYAQHGAAHCDCFVKSRVAQLAALSTSLAAPVITAAGRAGATLAGDPAHRPARRRDRQPPVRADAGYTPARHHRHRGPGQEAGRDDMINVISCGHGNRPASRHGSREVSALDVSGSPPKPPRIKL
jgi:hypothetical protein